MVSDSRVISEGDLDSLLLERLKIESPTEVISIHGKSERTLFEISGLTSGNIEWSTEAANTVRNAAERLGLIQISTEFYPSTHSLTVSQKGVKVDDHRHISWRGWFSEIANKRFLFPDTNILLKRTLTSIILPQFEGAQLKENKLPFDISIPRLAILELENLANNDHRNERASKGECFMAFNEIRVLKEKWGAAISVALTEKEFEVFNVAAGKRLTDAFIRNEIRKFGNAIFLTRDMISALAANSEDLDAIYMAPKFPDEMGLTWNKIAELREMITEVATDCRQITLRQGTKPLLFIEGVWSGKNWYDYYKRRVRVLSIN